MRHILSIILATFTIGLAAFVQQTPQVVEMRHWQDLYIANQIQIVSGIGTMIVIIAVAAVIFRSVWIRKGYEGLDDKLEAKEVATMLSHVIAFFLLLIFDYMITFNPYMQKPFPDYAFWICAGGFVGPEIYILVSFLRQFKPTKKIEE